MKKDNAIFSPALIPPSANTVIMASSSLSLYLVLSSLCVADRGLISTNERCLSVPQTLKTPAYIISTVEMFIAKKRFHMKLDSASPFSRPIPNWNSHEVEDQQNLQQETSRWFLSGCHPFCSYCLPVNKNLMRNSRSQIRRRRTKISACF
jgi:hypothetical protein